MTSSLETIRELNQQAWALAKKDGPRAVALARQAEDLIGRCPEAEPADLYQCLKTLTYCLDMLGKPEEAISVGSRANRLAEQIGDKYMIGSIQSLIARAYWHIDDFPTAMDYYLKALKLVQSESHPDLEVSLLNGLGMVQYGLENYSEALGYFKTCLAKATPDDLTGQADADNNIAYVLHLLGQDVEALEYGLAGLALFDQLGLAVGKMHTGHTVGAIYFSLGQADQAMAILQAGLELARQNDSPLMEVSYMLEISRLHQAQGDLSQAESELGAELGTAERIGSLSNISLIHERLVELYKARGDYRSALAHYEAFHTVFKQIFNEKSDRRIKSLEVLHEVEIARKQADLYRELAGTDFLTNLLNRRRFLEIAEHAFQIAESEAGRLAILMLDIDHFKYVNDQYGHKAGDEVLLRVAAAIKDCLRQNDVVGRYGGEEFLILAPGVTVAQSVNLAERVRQAVARLSVAIGLAQIGVTVSVGVVVIQPEPGLSIDTLIGRADLALYTAKRRGRNRVVSWEESRETDEAGRNASS